MIPPFIDHERHMNLRYGDNETMEIRRNDRPDFHISM